MFTGFFTVKGQATKYVFKGATELTDLHEAKLKGKEDTCANQHWDQTPRSPEDRVDVCYCLS